MSGIDHDGGVRKSAAHHLLFDDLLHRVGDRLDSLFQLGPRTDFSGSFNAGTVGGFGALELLLQLPLVPLELADLPLELGDPLPLWRLRLALAAPLLRRQRREGRRLPGVGIGAGRTD